MNHILDKLYRSTLTPIVPIEDRRTPELQSLAEWIALRGQRRNRYARFGTEGIRSAVHFILDFVSAPVGLNGVLKIEGALFNLIERALSNIEAGQEDAYALMCVAQDWFDALRSAPPTRVRIYNKPPDHVASPLFRFNTDAYKHSLIRGIDVPHLYFTYGFKLHIALRHKEIQNPAPGTLLGYARTARFFFRYISRSIKSRPDHPSAILVEYLRSFVRGYNKAFRGSHKEEMTDSGEAHLSRFRSLCEGHNIIKRAPAARRKGLNSNAETGSYSHGIIDDSRHEAHPAQGNVNLIQTPDKGESREAIHIPLDDESESPDDHEAPLEFALVECPDKAPVLEKRPSVPKRNTDLINLRSFQFTWDPDYMNLFHYSVLYQVMDNSWDTSDKNRAIILFLFLLIHTGIDPKQLLDLRVDVFPDGDPPKLIKAGRRYHIYHKSPVPSRNIQSYDNCHSASSSVMVPLPPIAGDLASVVLTHRDEYVFIYHIEQRRRRLTLNDVETFIKLEVTLPYASRQFNFSLPVLRRSFSPLYSCRFGLDPLMSIYIAGEDTHRIYGSQIHYVFIDHNKLASEYLRTFSGVHNGIIENLAECARRGYLEGSSSLSLFATGQEMPDEDEPSHSWMPGGYGSSIVATQEFASGIVRRLNHALRSERDIIRRHNLYSVYTYLCLQFSTGLRPRNNPDLTWDNYSCGTMTISDKQSANYLEERTLPLPPVLCRMLDRMRNGYSAIRHAAAMKSDPSVLLRSVRRIFFLVDERNRFTEFTLKQMSDIIKGTGSTLEIPLNFPRHFLRSHLYNLGVSNDAADTTMGHQRSGRELLNICSSSFLNSSPRVCLEAIESMIEKLGFVDIPYVLPGRTWK